MTPDVLTISPTKKLSAAERAEVAALESASVRVDGVAPLDDQVHLDLQYGAGADAAHLLARASNDGPVVGYAHESRADGAAVTAHLAVLPQQRRTGIATALVERLLDGTEGLPLRLWAHGDGDAARGFADRLGFRPTRQLLRMSRDMTEPLPQPTYPADVTIGAFTPGEDDEEWVRVNAVAFREHPEQGQMTVDDLRQRMSQPWFDPAGFFIAKRAGTMVGFHWTKVHDERLGEVYVVGVAPDARGSGLGKALTLTGLRHLRSLGLTTVMLYVDGDNTAAVGLYEALGFTRAAVDVVYEHP